MAAYIEFSASPYRATWDVQSQIQVMACPEESPDDPIGLIGAESDLFSVLRPEDAELWLTERGCDPLHARMLVGVACCGRNGVRIRPSEGFVDVYGDRASIAIGA